jgi:hypothetical protein
VELSQQANWNVKKMAKLCSVSTQTLERHFLKTLGKSLNRISGQPSAGRDQARKSIQHLSAQAFALDRQPPTLSSISRLAGKRRSILEG